MYKESKSSSMWNGIVWPLIAVALGLYTVFSGEAYWPIAREPGRGSWGLTFTDGWRVYGTAVLYFSVAAWLFTWSYLANWDSTARLVRTGYRITGVLAALGVGLSALGFVLT